MRCGIWLYMPPKLRRSLKKSLPGSTVPARARLAESSKPKKCGRSDVARGAESELEGLHPNQRPHWNNRLRLPRSTSTNKPLPFGFGALRPLLDVSKRPWLREFSTAYRGLFRQSKRPKSRTRRRASRGARASGTRGNPLLAHTLVGLSEAEIDDLALKRIIVLPDEPFFDVTPQFLRAVDATYFNDHSLETPRRCGTSTAPSAAPQEVRKGFIDRLKNWPAGAVSWEPRNDRSYVFC